MKKRKLVFGMGSGRCGTASLALLLNNQENSLVTHEMFPVLPWDISNTTSVQFRWEQLHHQSHLYDMVGDVAAYYLPYVEFLMRSLAQVPHLQKGFDFKFIILRRDPHEVVQSFLLKFERQNNNPLQNHGDPSIVQNEWDACYPKYDDVSLPQAVELYCKDYYAKAQELQELFPENVRIFEMKCLNSEEGVLSMLNFIGIENPRVITGIRKNQS